MISFAAAAGVIVVVSAALAVRASDGRLVTLAMFLALVAAPFASAQFPTSLEIAERAVAAALAGYVLWIAMQGGAVRSEGSGIGLFSELAVAGAAYVIGWWISPVQPLQGSLNEQAVGFALLALAALPLAGSSVLRAGIGVVLLVLGASFVTEAWVGPAPALGQLALTALLVAIPAGLSLLVDSDDPVASVVVATAKTRPELPPARVPGIFAPSGAPFLPEGPAGSALPATDRGAPVDDAEAARQVPRPSIRFLGRNPEVRRPGTRDRIGYTRRLGGEDASGHGPKAGPESGREIEPESEDRPRPEDRPLPGARPGPEAGPTDASERLRDGRDPRNPRLRRPLR
jgi:hypothetical protein